MEQAEKQRENYIEKISTLIKEAESVLMKPAHNVERKPEQNLNKLNLDRSKKTMRKLGLFGH